MFRNGTWGITSWKHPNPSQNPEEFAPRPVYPGKDFEPCYDELSYTWVSKATQDIIEVKIPTSAAARLQVGNNLFSALKHLRNSHKRRKLWVDQICINQDDFTERSEHVQRMGSIFKCAQRIVVWLGPGTRNSKLAMETMAFLGAQLECTTNLLLIAAPDATRSEWITGSAQDLPYSDEAWQAIQDLLASPWFDRLWVQQEVFNANRHAVILFGNSNMRWDHFRRSVLYIALVTGKEKDKRHISEQINSFGYMLQINVHVPRNTYKILIQSRNKLCADPRDKVYALLGLIDPIFTRKVTVDYSLPFQEVYKRTIIKLLEWNRRIDFGGYNGLQNHDKSLPSWVPDLSRLAGLEGGIYRIDSFASGNSCSDVKLRNSQVLELTGIQCGTVETVSEPVPTDIEHALQEIQSWTPLGTLESSKFYLNGESLLDAFVRTLLQDNISELRMSHDGRWDRWRPLQYWKDLFISLLASKDLKTDFLMSLSGVVQNLQGRSFLRSKNSYMTIGSPYALPGDLICVFLGSSSPTILRRSLAGRYKLVGSAYVHGLGNPTAFLGPLPQHLRLVMAFSAESMVSRIILYNSAGTYFSLSKDPRLGPRLRDWELTVNGPDTLNPHITPWYRNTLTGEIINSDPRLLPELLRAKGVELETFELE